MSDDKEVTTPDDPKVSMMYWHERAMAAEAALASERAKPTKRMTPTAAQIELAKDAVAFLDLNGMHLAAGVVRRYVLKE